MQRDVLIVGFGLAGWALTKALKRQGISFVVFDAQKNSSSKVATGIYNPVVLKRFRSIWNAKTLMEHSIPFYTQSNSEGVVHQMPIHRVLASVSEQNDWVVAADKPDLCHYLNPKISPNTNSGVHAPFGLGIVEHTGWIDTNRLLTIAQKELEQQNDFVTEAFDYNLLDISAKDMRYKGVKINHVIFAEGVSVQQNPWFSALPIISNKGEWLLVLCKGLALKNILKGSVFIVPLGGDHYRVGATYVRSFKNNLPTNEGKTWLIRQLKKITPLPFEILYHGVGFRPTVPDRKPIMGQHPTYDNLWCLNGLGSRGVLWAPYLATTLVAALHNGVAIPENVHLSRYLTASQH